MKAVDELTREDILAIIKRAKELYLEHPEYIGMCHCLGLAYEGKDRGWTEWGCSGKMVALIPEFNRTFLEAPESRRGLAYWWAYDSHRGYRINAFDKLIKHYSEKLDN